jgi:TolA-binding protein
VGSLGRVRRALAVGIAGLALAGPGCGDDEIDDLRNNVDKAIDENRSADELRDLLDDARKQGDDAQDEVERLRRELRRKIDQNVP